MNHFTVTQAELQFIKSDLNRAKKYLRFLELEKDKPGSAASVREALSLAAVVAYNRPFTSCHRAGGGSKRPWIPSGLVNDIPTKFHELHKGLRKQRNEIWAHTDGNAFDTTNPIKVLPRTVIPYFHQLIKEVMGRLRDR